ncbi:MAG TPA: hypothetical protein VFP46_01060 [Candidatus Paceibacterota bacterium]|nr:hypothetical protein [Candidatus Paceibacterota bacterium]
MLKYVLTIALILLVGYGLVEAWPLIAGPTLVISSPEDDAAFADGIVPVLGQAARAADLTLDGAPLLHDQEGRFSSTLTFPHGTSILTFVAKDRFGRTVTATRHILVP